MPTELIDEHGEVLPEAIALRDRGKDAGFGEYGATTGRPRRCGWFDAVAARYSCRINSLTSAVLTRLDVLDEFDTIKICTGYEVDGGRLDRFPACTRVLARCRPVYEEVPGWKSETAGIRQWKDLPQAARSYLRRLEALVGCPIRIASVGPERGQAIPVENAGS